MERERESREREGIVLTEQREKRACIKLKCGEQSEEISKDENRKVILLMTGFVCISLCNWRRLVSFKVQKRKKLRESLN